MDRQEDPSFPYRRGLLTVTFPGASPEHVNRQVIKPLEKRLTQVEEIVHIDATARQGIALIDIKLHDTLRLTDNAWDRVRIAIGAAGREFPQGVGTPELDDRLVGTSTVVFALTGAAPLALAEAAKRLRDDLLALPEVSTANLTGDPGEQITVALEDAAMLRYGITPATVITQLQQSNRVVPGGTLHIAGKSVAISPISDLRSVEEIGELPIALPDGSAVPLASIAEVYRSAEQPPREQVWWDGERAVAVEIRVRRDAVDIVTFGAQVRRAVDALRPAYAPIQIREMFFQPRYTEARLNSLGKSLIYSMAIIAALLFATMGLRLGLIVASILPMVALSTLAVYALGGGVLHQMAIIGMVIALGVLVDNAVVMTENAQWHLNRGLSPAEAAKASAATLAWPLLTATGTTVSAFLPLMLAKGDTGDFTRAMPVMITLALLISYLYAVTVTPLLARRFLRHHSDKPARGSTLLGRLMQLTHYSTRRPWRVIFIGVIGAAGAGSSALFIEHRFFPEADRNQVIIDLLLPEGTHLSATAQAAHKLETALRHRPGVLSVHGFIGGSGPVFYYNLTPKPSAPQRARLVVNSDALTRNQALIAWVDDFSRRQLPDVEVVAKVLQQGPPLSAPIVVRVYNPDAARLAEATETVFRALAAIPGGRSVRHDLGTGVPTVEYAALDTVARQLGTGRTGMAETLLGRTHGLPAGHFRGGDDPVPIRIRSPQGEHYDINTLESAMVYASIANTPLMQLATTRLTLEPGAIYRRDQRRLARVYADLQPGTVYSRVLHPLRAKLATLSLPAQTVIEFGGEVEESGKANAAIATVAPVGIILLLLLLLQQFKSFRRVGLILLTIPFALAGIFPGLMLLGFPFGFQTLQGVIALVGIVVNNAILLIDLMDRRLIEGADIKSAVEEAVQRRTRPILLTAATTLCGLLPLAFSGTTLWPPIAWTIICGLISSTLLTLLVLPAICTVLLAPKPVTA
jgi:multidrug efflux pump subunit AcrB